MRVLRVVIAHGVLLQHASQVLRCCCSSSKIRLVYLLLLQQLFHEELQIMLHRVCAVTSFCLQDCCNICLPVLDSVVSSLPEWACSSSITITSGVQVALFTIKGSSLHVSCKFKAQVAQEPTYVT